MKKFCRDPRPAAVFVVHQRDALVAVIGEDWPAQRWTVARSAALPPFAALTATLFRLCAQHAFGIVAGGMNCTVNDEARLDGVRIVASLLPARSILTSDEAVISSNMKP